MVWDKITGEPLFNAIVWLDARTADLAIELTKKTPNNDKEYFKKLAGLPIHPYFSALKFRWLIDNVPEVKNALEQGSFFWNIKLVTDFFRKYPTQIHTHWGFLGRLF